MGEGAVGAEEGDDAHEVQSGFPLFGGVHDLQEGLVLEEGAVGDGPVDADPVGIDPSAGADVEMSGLGVAHGARGQAHGFTGGRQDGKGTFRKQPVHDGRPGGRQEVAVGVFPVAPAVEEEIQNTGVFPLSAGVYDFPSIAGG